VKVPFIKYIETLVVGRLDPRVIMEELAAVNIEFPLIGVSYVVDTLREINPEYFEQVVPPMTPPVPDSVWLNDIGIEKMYGYKFNIQLPAGTLGIAGAFKIINDPLMYRLITSMALANITAEDIELIVNGKYNIEYSSDDVVCFLHYFFNLKDWTIQDKTSYAMSVTKPELKTAYSIALKGDKDYLLWKLGAAPDKSFDSMLRDMMVDSYYNFKERSKTDPDLAQKWGTLAIKLTDRMEKLEKETADKKDMFADIQFQIRRGPSDSSGTPEPTPGSTVSINFNLPHIEGLTDESRTD